MDNVLLDRVEVWLGEIRVGTIESHKNQIRRFMKFYYTPEYLFNSDSVSLSPQLPLVDQVYEIADLSPIFDDVTPDKWGKSLIQRANPQTFLEDFDYMLLATDFDRQGAIRFSKNGGETFLSDGSNPPHYSINKLQIEEHAKNISSGKISQTDVHFFTTSGTGVGGTQPKMSVIDNDGDLSILKVSNPSDIRANVAWEAATLELAKNSGIEVEKFSFVKNASGDDIIIAKRFDRSTEGSRIPYMSARTFLGANLNAPSSYSEFAKNLSTISSSKTYSLTQTKELFRRVAFTLLVSNNDDHLKNHGLLFRNNCWGLAPMFDANALPTTLDGSTPVSGSYAQGRNIFDLYKDHQSYGLDLEDAKDIIKFVEAAISNWREIAAKYVDREEIESRRSAFEHESRKMALNLPDQKPQPEHYIKIRN
jgi:serine/threonine-protein kinase HipA